MAEGREIDETESIRIAELFLVFIVVSLLFGRLMKFLEHHMHGTARRGLRHTVHHIEEELLALGVISLLLIVSEDYLIKICVHNDDYESDSDDHSSSDYGDSHSSSEDDHHRKLLAGGGDSECSRSKEPFWSAQTIHQTHIFIFLIAIVHVLYATTSFLFCLWRIQRWKRFEEDQSLVLETLEHSPIMYGRNAFEYWLWSFWAQFSPSVDEALYLAMRYLFIERLELPQDFNFHLFLLNTMVDEFAIVVHTDWQMWVVAAIWILVPNLLLVTTALSVFIVLLVGTKLELVGVMLSQQAYLSHGNRAEGRVQPQSIAGPRSLILKPIEIISKQLGKTSTSRRNQNPGLELISHSMRASMHQESGISESAMRKTQSNAERDHNSVEIEDVGPRKEVRFEVESDHPDSNQIEDQMRGNFADQRQFRGTLPRSFSKNYRVPDAATYFWFGRPRLILRALQFVYFETAMAIAVVFFDLWQSSDFILQDTVNLGSEYLLIVILIVVGVLCLLQTSFLMLPTYVLTSVAGSHCPENVLAQAGKLLKKSRAITRVESIRHANVLHRLETLDATHRHTERKGHNSNNTAQMLVAEMAKGKIERMKQAQEQEQRQDSPNSTDDPSCSSRINLVDGGSQRQDPETQEDDPEMNAIIKAFGSFQRFLESIKLAQNAVRLTYPEALFNFDTDSGSYNGLTSTSFDEAAINLTLDLNAAKKTPQHPNH